MKKPVVKWKRGKIYRYVFDDGSTGAQSDFSVSDQRTVSWDVPTADGESEAKTYANSLKNPSPEPASSTPSPPSTPPPAPKTDTAPPPSSGASTSPPPPPSPPPPAPPQPSTGGAYDYKKAYDFQQSKGWLYPGETMESFKTDMDAALANVAALTPDEQQKLWQNETAVGRTTQNFQEWYNSMPKPWTPSGGGADATMGEKAGAQSTFEQEQFNPLTLMLVERLKNYLPQLQASRAKVLAGESPELGPYYKPEPLGGRTNFRGGGVVPGPMGSPRRITAHGGEIVIDPMAKLTDAILTHIMRGA